MTLSSVATVSIHSSQFPESVRRDLLESLRSRRVNHKFHYDSIKQAQKWLALHQAYSPSRNDPDCAAIYDQSFEAVASQIPTGPVRVIGLGSGGGQKDARLIKLLCASGRRVSYTPVDVSTALALTAREEAIKIISAENCFPMVADLGTAEDFAKVLDCQAIAGESRLLTFFGMLPNFESEIILPKLASFVRAGDHLLASANLAPGPDCAAGIGKILPLYDNPLTRDWLLTFLLDLGVERGDGELRFAIGDAPDDSGLKRVAAWFHFSQTRKLQVESTEFTFKVGESIRLFFSYRHTPEIVSRLLKKHGLRVVNEWLTRSQEEGVFLVVKALR